MDENKKGNSTRPIPKLLYIYIYGKVEYLKYVFNMKAIYALTPTLIYIKYEKIRIPSSQNMSNARPPLALPSQDNVLNQFEERMLTRGRGFRRAVVIS